MFFPSKLLGDTEANRVPGVLRYAMYDADAPTGMPASAGPTLPIFEPEAASGQVRKLVVRGLTDLSSTGRIQAILAQEIPTVENGLVSPDLLRVTWRLRPDLHWSDGRRITAHDVGFTCDYFAESPQHTMFRDIRLWNVRDDTTIEIEYSKPFFSYALQFRDGIIPRPPHGARALPFGIVEPTAGPFVVDTYVPNLMLSLKRNPYFYRRGLPRLEGIDLLFRSDRRALVQMVLRGEADLGSALTQPEDDEVAALLHARIQLGSGSSRYFNRLQINMPADRDDPLADSSVRRAIFLATDVAWITRNWNVPGGRAPTYLSTRPQLDDDDACGAPQSVYSPEEASDLLDAAGWVRDADGVRSRNGRRFSLTVNTYSGFGQELNAAHWVVQLRNQGVDAQLGLFSERTFYGGWSDSPVTSGNFDLLYYDRGRDLPGIDEEMIAFYHSSSVPSAANPLGRNVNRIRDETIDRQLKAAERELNWRARRELYCAIADRVSRILQAERWTGLVPNYQYSSSRLRGWTDGERFTWFGQGCENWYLTK